MQLALVRSLSAPCIVLALASCSAAAPVSAPAVLSTHYVSTLQAADAAYDRGDYHLAASLYDPVARRNPVNPTYWRRLAASHYLAGEYAQAIPAYKIALRLRQDQPATLAYYLARSYGKAGDPRSGMRWLRQAMRWGYANLEDARTDVALRSLGGQSGFNDLLGIVDATRMTRVQGWRYDLAFLSRWAKVKTYHPFRTDTGDRFVSGAIYTESEFDQRVKTLDRDLPSMSDVSIELAMMRLVASLGDGHTELGGARRPEYGQTLPLKFELFHEGLFVTAAEPAYRSLVGAQILAMDGRGVSSVLAAVAPYISRDNDYWLTAVEPYRLRSIPFLHAAGLTNSPQRVSLRVRALDGRMSEVPVQVTTDSPDIWNTLPSPAGWVNLYEVLPAKPPVYLTRTNEYHWFEYEPAQKLVYVQYNKVLDGDKETLAAFATRLGSFLGSHEVDKLVIDMRWNNGGDTFLNQPLLAALACSAVNRQGHLFVIIGPRTFSAGTNAAVSFERDLHAIFVGEPTGGKPNAPGDETFFTLPYSKISINFSNVYWEAGWPQDERWSLAPAIYTPRTFAHYVSGTDAAMDAVIAYPNE
jgi:tetratricopeptide (TPR) repeat protein